MIILLSMNELKGILMAYKAERHGEGDQKGKESIAFKPDTYDVDDSISSYEVDENEKMALLTKSLKQLVRKRRNFKGKKQTNESKEGKLSKSQEDNKGRI